MKNTNEPGMSEMRVLRCGSKQLESSKKTFDTNDLRCTGEEYGARTMVNLNGVSAPETSPDNEEGFVIAGRA